VSLAHKLGSMTAIGSIFDIGLLFINDSILVPLDVFFNTAALSL